jgi:hypothetical protein
MHQANRFVQTGVGLGALALLLASAGQGRADPIINNVGISNPALTVTFSEYSPATGTPITTLYSSLGVTFSPSLFYNVQPDFFPTPSLANFDTNGNANNPVTIQFSQNQTAAAFALQTNPGTSTFTALLNGIPVQSFTAATSLSVLPDLTNASNYYGFQGILFNQIQITSNTTFFQLDNLQLSNYGAAPGVALFTNPAAFSAATTQGSTFNFDGLTDPNSFTYFGSSVTTSGVTFATSDANLFAIGSGYFGGIFSFGSALAVLQDNNNPSSLTATLPPGVTAFSLDLGSQVTNTGTGVLTVTTADGVFFFPINIPEEPDLAFLGITSTEPIISFSVTTGDFGLSYADVTLAQTIVPVPVPVPVPEPSSLALMALGGLGVAGWRRWRKRSTVS